MAKVEIVRSLKDIVLKKFKGDAKKIFRLMESVGESPAKGKFIGRVNKIVIKELKYKSSRFYFLVDDYSVKFLGVDELKDLLIRFVRMSDKNSQQKVIEEIKDFLRKI